MEKYDFLLKVHSSYLLVTEICLATNLSNKKMHVTNVTLEGTKCKRVSEYMNVRIIFIIELDLHALWFWVSVEFVMRTFILTSSN